MVSWNLMEHALNEIQHSACTPRVCIGFDGYVDTLCRVIKRRMGSGEVLTYQTIAEFAERVGKSAGRSADMELQLLERRMGGNAPLMAEAMGSLGVRASCIGAMGYPERDEVFSDQRIHFTARSVAPSAACLALEFNDGKLMFGQNQSLLELDWGGIVEIMGLVRLRQWYADCSLWAVVNWSFLLHSNDILEGFLTDVAEAVQDDRKRILFVDLADSSGRSREELQRLFSILGRFETCCAVVLSMNENESDQVANALSMWTGGLAPEEKATAIRERLGIRMSSVHGLGYAAVAWEGQSVLEESIYVPSPRISTGGGDHFNGGFAAGLIHGLPPGEAIAFGNLVSSCYVSTGRSPILEELRNYLIRNRT